MEEAFNKKARETGKFYIRTSEIVRPAAVVARHEDISDINTHQCSVDGIDFTRRLSNGSVIWLDDRSLAYFLIAPWGTPTEINTEKIHQNFGRKIGLVLRDLGVQNVYIGGYGFTTICLGKGPQYVVAGNSAGLRGGRVSFQGILVLERLDLESIKRYIVLRKNEKVDEEGLIAQLPNFYDVVGEEISRKELALRIVHRLTDGNYRLATQEELKEVTEEAKLIEPKYRSPDWIFDSGNGERNKGFCLLIRSEEWKGKNFRLV